MEITIRKNVITVVHEGNGNSADAIKLCNKIRDVIYTELSDNKEIKLAIFHDSRKLHGASRTYATEFGLLFIELRKLKLVQVALIEKVMLRNLAKLALQLSKTEMEIFSTHNECIKFLKEQGFLV